MERRLRVRKPLLLVEHGTKLEGYRRVGGELRLDVPQQLHRVGAATGVRVELRERDVRRRLVGVFLHDLLQHGDALIGFSRLPERLRLESREPQIVWPLAARHTREIGRHRVFLARQVGFDQVAGDGRILRGQTMRFVERRNRLVELTELLIREPEMRQQKAELE